MTNKNSHLFKSGVALGVALWANVNEKGSVSFKVSKSYKAADGSYKPSDYLFAVDLAALALLIPEALRWADVEREKSKKETAARAETEQASQPDDDDVPF